MGDTRIPSGQQDWRVNYSNWSEEAEAQITKSTIKVNRMLPGLQYI